MMRLSSPRLAAVALATGLLAMWPVLSDGAVIVSLNNSGSETLHEISVNPGDEFQIDLRFAPGTGCGLVTMHFKAGTAGVLKVIDGAWLSPWIGSVPVGGVDPLSGGFGGGLPLGSRGAGPLLATMSIGVDVNGAYTLNMTGIVGASSVISQDYIVGEAGPDFSVRVVPEPSGFMLVSAFVLLTGRRV